jgi:hypothetical protein
MKKSRILVPLFAVTLMTLAFFVTGCSKGASSGKISVKMKAV